MQAPELPTWNDIVHKSLSHLDAARDSMSSVRDWLNSDWRPVGSSLTDEAAEARVEVSRRIGQIKTLIDEAKNYLYQAENGTGRR